MATPIPILLLKTRSLPHDTYESYLSSSTSTPPSSHTQITFSPTFIPVLEHTYSEPTLSDLAHLLRTGELKRRYGGMIFTSQRAVEAWADVVERVERKDRRGIPLQERDQEQEQAHDGHGCAGGNEVEHRSDLTAATDSRTKQRFTTDVLTSTAFPLYVVGPATGRALETLIHTLTSQRQRQQRQQASPFLSLLPSIHGAHTGSGAQLGPFIKSHYNAQHASTVYTFHTAPRLPFIPLLGMGSENYSKRVLGADDARLQKRPLLFLVGEVRRDVIPRILMGGDGGGADGERIVVEEREVYATVVKEGVEAVVRKAVGRDASGHGKGQVVVIVVFSPQGSGDVLRAIGFIDEEGKVTSRAERRWDDRSSPRVDANRQSEVDAGAAVSRAELDAERRYVIVTIGPTTRDHLRDTFGFEADVCAKKPSPEGVREGVELFLREKGLV